MEPAKKYGEKARSVDHYVIYTSFHPRRCLTLDGTNSYSAQSRCGAHWHHKIGEEAIDVHLGIIIGRDAQCQRPDWQ